jgi:2-polyprenyl-6-methoxyphenol hydroxylase-like FAD-dependent oxidoreductase
MLEHVVVMGGSIAGLCAAAGMAKVAKRVTVIERDPDPGGASPRKSTPQANHLHGLLRLGAQSIETLMPGVFASLDQRGGRTLDMASDFRWFIAGEWRPRFDAQLPVRMQSRPLLEAVLREHVQRRAEITCRFGTPVVEPVFSDKHQSVTGIRLADGEELEADLIIDATGRGSRSVPWFESWGFSEPPVQQIQIGLSYVTANVRFSPKYTPPSQALLIYPKPPSLMRGTTLFHLEDERWISTSFGYHGDHPPTEIPQLRDWLETLAVPDAACIMRHAEFVGPLSHYNIPRQIRRLYHELSRRPKGYLVVGDAACAFDPVFGQGMAVAATQAVELSRAVARGETNIAVLQKIVGKVADGPWRLASTESQRWPQSRGYRPPGAKLLTRFVDRFYSASANDQRLHRLFLEVMHLEKPVTSLLAPSVLGRLLIPRSA